jgi:hypothetical protein
VNRLNHCINSKLSWYLARTILSTGMCCCNEHTASMRMERRQTQCVECTVGLSHTSSLQFWLTTSFQLSQDEVLVCLRSCLQQLREDYYTHLINMKLVKRCLQQLVVSHKFVVVTSTPVCLQYCTERTPQHQLEVLTVFKTQASSLTCAHITCPQVWLHTRTLATH